MGSNSYLCTYGLFGPVRNVLMRADTLRGQVGGGWALEIESFLGPLKWHRADRRRRVGDGGRLTWRATAGGGGGVDRVKGDRAG